MEDAAIDKLLEQRVEGLLYAATWHRAVHVPEIAREVPTVLVNCFDADGNCRPSSPTSAPAAASPRASARRRPHRRIGFINLDPDIPAAVGRREGYREALAEAGLDLDPELVVPGHATADGGYEAACEILDRRPGHGRRRCSADNDRMAMGAYDAIKERGLPSPTTSP